MKLHQLTEQKKSVNDLSPDEASLTISNTFHISGLGLTSLHGSPKDVNHIFCYSNELTSLEGGPKSVMGNYWAYGNKLTTLKGAPITVGMDFQVHNQDGHLKSLQYSPRSCKRFDASNNRLTTLVGGPDKAETYICENNLLTSFEGIAPHTEEIRFGNNKITSLAGINKFVKSCREISLVGNNITSHVLGLILIEDLRILDLDNKKVLNIINRHLGKGMPGVLDAQEELIDAGLEEFAKL